MGEAESQQRILASNLGGRNLWNLPGLAIGERSYFIKTSGQDLAKMGGALQAHFMRQPVIKFRLLFNVMHAFCQVVAPNVSLRSVSKDWTGDKGGCRSSIENSLETTMLFSSDVDSALKSETHSNPYTIIVSWVPVPPARGLNGSKVSAGPLLVTSATRMWANSK